MNAPTLQFEKLMQHHAKRSGATQPDPAFVAACRERFAAFNVPFQAIMPYDFFCLYVIGPALKESSHPNSAAA